MPGGPVDDGQEPLWDEPADPANADLIQAAPAATAGLHAAFEAVLAELPRYTGGRGYYPHGVPGLCEAIAQRYRDRGAPTSADQIVVTGGANAAMSLGLAALTAPRSRVLLESPGYPNTVAAVRVDSFVRTPFALRPDQISQLLPALAQAARTVDAVGEPAIA